MTVSAVVVTLHEYQGTVTVDTYHVDSPGYSPLPQHPFLQTMYNLNFFIRMNWTSNVYSPLEQNKYVMNYHTFFVTTAISLYINVHSVIKLKIHSRRIYQFKYLKILTFSTSFAVFFACKITSCYLPRIILRYDIMGLTYHVPIKNSQKVACVLKYNLLHIKGSCCIGNTFVSETCINTTSAHSQHVKG